MVKNTRHAKASRTNAITSKKEIVTAKRQTNPISNTILRPLKRTKAQPRQPPISSVKRKETFARLPPIVKQSPAKRMSFTGREQHNPFVFSFFSVGFENNPFTAYWAWNVSSDWYPVFPNLGTFFHSERVPVPISIVPRQPIPVLPKLAPIPLHLPLIKERTVHDNLTQKSTLKCKSPRPGTNLSRSTVSNGADRHHSPRLHHPLQVSYRHLRIACAL